MPKTEIDYSNTIIYKISCKDNSCKELYVGHTTNFVQRKYAHKQTCINSKSEYHNLKLYKVIRENGGWDNWKMEIIHFCNCTNSNEARKKEQEFYESLNATLNSIQPFQNPNSKLIEKDKPKPMYYCELCKIYTTSLKSLEKHKEETHSGLSQIEIISNKTTRDSKKIEKSPLEKDTKKYNCDFCSYSCSKKNEWERHILRPKHIERENSKNIQDYCSLFTCENCNSVYKSTSGLWYHKKKCIKKIEQPETKNDKVVYDTDFDFKSMFIDLMKQNEEFKKIMLEQNTKMMELASTVNTNITSITNNKQRNYQ